MMWQFDWRVRFCVGLAAIVGLGLIASPTLAANVSFVTLHYSADRFVPQFQLDGPVVEGDAAALAEIIDEFVNCTPELFDQNGSNCAVITLNSPGGSYIEGLRLAALMRERALATVVEADAQCYSACAFAFLGGSGYSQQSGVGAYIDRIIEPGGILGFHAPYFAPDSLDGLVAEFGLDEILGASRDDISLMIQQLVEWNVNPNALSYIVRMGPSETYDIVAGGDYTLLWAQLPPAPLYYWNSTPNSALRNACMNLLAFHQNTWPDAVMEQVPSEIEAGVATNEQGQTLDGFRIQADNPLGVSYCALPQDQADLSGDIDLALYSGSGISGVARPIVSLFNRVNGWSSMGTGGEPTRRNMQKGSMSHLFVDILDPIVSDFVHFMEYLPLRKFARFTESGQPDMRVEFPISDLPMTVSGRTSKVQVMKYGAQQVIAEAGSELLYNTAKTQLTNRFDAEVTLAAEYENGFVVGGRYPSGHPYLWVGLKGTEGATVLVRIEPRTLPEDVDAALIEQQKIACSLTLHGHGLECT